jgi:hypothetical protein
LLISQLRPYLRAQPTSKFAHKVFTKAKAMLGGSAPVRSYDGRRRAGSSAKAQESPIHHLPACHIALEDLGFKMRLVVKDPEESAANYRKLAEAAHEYEQKKKQAQDREAFQQTDEFLEQYNAILAAKDVSFYYSSQMVTPWAEHMVRTAMLTDDDSTPAFTPADIGRVRVRVRVRLKCGVRLTPLCGRSHLSLHPPEFFTVTPLISSHRHPPELFTPTHHR